jgi:hypothetical protein
MRKKTRGSFENGALYAIILVIVLLFGGLSCGVQRSTQDHITVNVVRRERVSGENSKYLVWVKHKDGKEETLQCTDSLAFFKFNSSDVYGKLYEGETYKLHVAGYRFGPTSSYRNIISIE